MGAGASIDSSSSYIEVLKKEAAKDPDNFSELSTEAKLREELTRLRKQIQNCYAMVQSIDDKGTIIDRELHALLDRAAQVEAWLTPLLQEIEASTKDCQLTGLQFRFKGFDSLKRKLEGNLKASERNAMKTKTNLQNDIATEVNNITDSLRYTMLIPSGQYTKTVVQLRNKLLQQNFQSEDLKNYWSEGDMYQGINDVFREKSTKICVEIQYHTPESWELKSDAHVIYEKFRICSEPLEQLKLFAEGAALANTVQIPEGVMSLPTLTKKSAPELVDAFATQIVAASSSVKKSLVDWCRAACPKAKVVEANVDTERIIHSELSSLVLMSGLDVINVSQLYYDGFKVSIVCAPEDYVNSVNALCAKSKQESSGGDAKLKVSIKEGRNYYDKVKNRGDDVEGVRLNVVIGSQKSNSVYDNIRCSVHFYTPDSLETEQRVLFLSQLLVTNPGLSKVRDEIRDLWLRCPDPPGAPTISAFNDIPDIPQLKVN